MSEQDNNNKQEQMEAPELSDEIRRLIRTPVGRRLFLKLGGASALKVALGGIAFGSLGGCSSHHDDDVAPLPEDERPREIRHLYFALHEAVGAEDLVISVGESDYALELVTEAHRKALTASGGVWSKADPANLSHVARDVDLPSDRSLLLHVTGRIGDDTVYVAETIHVPRESMHFAWSAALELAGSATQLIGETSWHEGLGVTAPEELSADELADLSAITSYHSIAAGLVFKHPEIASLEKDSSGVTLALLLANPGVGDLGDQIYQLQQQAIPYAKEVPVLYENGDQVYIMDSDGTKVAANNAVINSALDDLFGRAVQLCVIEVKNNTDLEGATWHLTPGTPPQPIPVGLVSLPGDDDLKVTTGWTGYKHGIQITHDAFDSNTLQLPIKIYNNYVRYVGVYVQYFDELGKLMPPADTDSPNTEYSLLVTDLPDIPTLFGIPIFNTNYSEATLTFPTGASTARILVGGLGHSPHDSSWRDLFPSGAYPDRVMPPECTNGIVMTSILDIGVVIYFLAVDVATTVVADYYRRAAKSSPEFGDLQDIIEDLIKILESIKYVAPGLALATGIASGTATILDIKDARGKSTWMDLLKMGEVLARVIASAATSSEGRLWKWFLPLIGMMLKGDASKLIPVIGEALAAAAVVGDVAVLAQTSTEVAKSPWLVHNTIHVTYDATVTLYHDVKNGVFPRSATTWALTPIIGGSGSRDPFTGDVIPVGTRKDPIVVPVTKIPIGGTIQYSVVFINADGAQVGRGKSDVLPNNDTSNLPRDVEITTKEISIAITDSTIFKRQNTTAYSTADDGYTWTTDTDIGGTVQTDTDLLEINAITVGTVSTMAGYVWRSSIPSTQYWIRNLPTFQNEGQKTIQLQTGGPYPRKPLIIYDRLNPELVTGNNFLLEPYGDTGYKVRRLELSADGGRLVWKPESWGTFLNPLSALTLHPSGHLVGVNAQSGNLDILPIPDNPTPDMETDFVQLASSYAGPGTRPGLLDTPFGVAITVTGVIVVLEGGANQLQSFNLTGNPVAYFGTDPDNLSYYASLASGVNDTLLSLAVDGQGWFYVLSYTEGGSLVSDYAVDVYKQDGTHVVRSPGLNAATFDVDYWRNIFALNYAPLANTDGSPHVDATTGVVEPSTSICIPHNP